MKNIDWNWIAYLVFTAFIFCLLTGKKNEQRKI